MLFRPYQILLFMFPMFIFALPNAHAQASAQDDVVYTDVDTSRAILFFTEMLNNDAGCDKVVTSYDYTTAMGGSNSGGHVGGLNYTPPAGFSGLDWFTYHMESRCDNTTSSAIVYINVGQDTTNCDANTPDPYGKTIIASNILNGNVGNVQPDPNRALGAPDNAAVSLGGPGAYIIVDMGEHSPIINGVGDDFEIDEQGDLETYEVWVSNDPSIATFVFLGVGTATSKWDLIHVGMTEARYVYIKDLSTLTSNFDTPGSDIDAIRALHLPDCNRPTVTNLAYEVVQNGILLSWDPMPGALTYYVSRSLDGPNAFPNTPQWSTSRFHYARLDARDANAEERWYAVEVKYADGFSDKAIIHVPAVVTTLFTETYHLGDQTIPDWGVTESQESLTIQFNLEEDPEGPVARLIFDLWSVHYDNDIIINGEGRNDLPIHTPKTWETNALTVEAGLFKKGLNTITLLSRDSGGGSTGNLDDYMIRNMKVRWYKQADVQNQ